MDSKRNICAIHYVGDEGIAGIVPHGNSTSEEPFMPASELVTEAVKEHMGKTPTEVFNLLTSHTGEG